MNYSKTSLFAKKIIASSLKTNYYPSIFQHLIPYQQIAHSTTTTNILKNRPKYNKGLESVKEQGKSILEAIQTDIISKTKRRLLIEDEDTGPTIYQIKEATKLRSLIEEALEQYTLLRGNTFCILNEPIMIVDVEITEDLRQARVFWSLPLVILCSENERLDSRARNALSDKMQEILETRGGPLQAHVHNKLRSYFRPPKLRFVKAESEMLRKSLQELF